MVEREMGLIVQRIVEATGLKGLNSADFLVDGSRYHLLEINPRPGATIDIFDDADGWLFAAHIAACRGVLPASPAVFDDACAACVVYADTGIGKIPHINWPEWALDRQTAGSHVEAGAPLCTVTASAAGPTAAMNLLTAREEEMKRRLGGTKQ
jgi:predicted ATP-grasp superfamily ATP-dependent carboligase